MERATEQVLGEAGAGTAGQDQVWEEFGTVQDDPIRIFQPPPGASVRVELTEG